MRYGKEVVARMFVQEYQDQVDNALLGIAGEAGEILDHFKKLRYHPNGGDRTAAKLRAEIGDLLWYVAALAQLYFDESLLDIAKSNIEKLKMRYPERYNSVNVEEMTL